MAGKQKDIQKPKRKAQRTAPLAPPPSAAEADPAAPYELSARPDEPPKKHFPIVGIGASAGGLSAFKAFFSGMPGNVDPGMAFVLVQHLAPDYKSILAEILRCNTRMQVYEVEDGMQIKPNCVYIIPSNRDMAIMNGSLQLMEPDSLRSHRLPIDFFFRSLAQDQRERAIGIVLSGTGSDGTLGVRAIKSEGGLVMAQNPESSEFDGMPRSAIATGIVDYELPPAEMPAQLIAYMANASGWLHQPALHPDPKSEVALKKAVILVRLQTGHDFSQYKSSTLLRRVERRMALQKIEELDRYVKYLHQAPAEVQALFRDLLIGVTSFFRDPEAFKALEEKVIPRLFEDKSARALIRVWVPGCSTGEEAYSIAILMQERMEALKQSFHLQVFGTDIDRRAIATARSGIYPVNIASDISPERLRRFFAIEPGNIAYRICKSLRDMLVFSEQSIIRDPPFSKLDLISCRNLLIYMDENLQKKLVPLYHYSLKPGGFLFLGTSETVGAKGDLFATLDRKLKLYQRKEGVHSMLRSDAIRFLSPMAAVDGGRALGDRKTALPAKLPLRELTEQALLQQVAPAGALVDGQGNILYLHGRTGMYLEPAPGESKVNNILKMAREGLRLDLAKALYKAVGTKELVLHPNLRVKTNGVFTTVNLTVRPVAAGSVATLEAPLYLVILEQAPASAETAAVHANGPAAADNPDTATGTETDARVAALKRELRAKEEHLLATKEELDTTGEDLKSINQELQSVNEELQSANEELETTKEELQSTNEELSTINTELQAKVTDLSRTNNDMHNLMAGTGIATLFVDCQQRILRFTQGVSLITNLILNDVGRPVGHIVSNLVGYDRLVADTQAVLDTLISKEVEVMTLGGEWFIMRIQPYRTLDNVIEGAVITFFNITEKKLAQDLLHKASGMLRLAVVVRDANDAITVQDLEGRTVAWNRSAERVYGWSEAEAKEMNIQDRVPERLRESELANIKKLCHDVVLVPYHTWRTAKDGRDIAVSVTASALANESGQVYAISTTERILEGKEDA